MLGRYRGIPANAWLEEVISNLEYRFGVKSNVENLISFSQNEQLRGLEYLSEIIDYTISHQVLEIDYHTYRGKQLLSIVHPYYVKQYNNRWFLFGFDEKYKSISNIALDRIKSIKKSEIDFVDNKTVDFSTYFDDIIGVSVPDLDIKLEPIILRFSSERFPYVVSKPVHHSQVILDEKSCLIQIKVKPNRELRQQIFSFIPDIEVLSPDWFRKEIKGKIEKNLAKYLSMQNDCRDNDLLCAVDQNIDGNNDVKL